jgi:hypothetical protein
MIHDIFSFRLLFLFLFSFALLGVVGSMLWYPEARNVSTVLFPGVVFAEDDEDEEDEEDEEDDEDEEDEEDDDEKDTKKSYQESVITTYKLVEKTVTTLDEKFKIDTDGDLLVDGLDPHPTVPESAYFSDDDEDAVPNAVDAYPGKDDFFIFDDEADRDEDGLIDSFVMVTRE